MKININILKLKKKEIKRKILIRNEKILKKKKKKGPFHHSTNQRKFHQLEIHKYHNVKEIQLSYLLLFLFVDQDLVSLINIRNVVLKLLIYYSSIYPLLRVIAKLKYISRLVQLMKNYFWVFFRSKLSEVATGFIIFLC